MAIPEAKFTASGDYVLEQDDLSREFLDDYQSSSRAEDGEVFSAAFGQAPGFSYSDADRAAHRALLRREWHASGMRGVPTGGYQAPGSPEPPADNPSDEWDDAGLLQDVMK
jgi:hypothetical protein